MSRRLDDIPAKLIMPHVQSYVERGGIDSLFALAEKAGVDESQLRHMKSPGRVVRFDVADKILCAIEGAGLWYRDPHLAKLYPPACKEADQVEARRGLPRPERDAHRYGSRRDKILARQRVYRERKKAEREEQEEAA